MARRAFTQMPLAVLRCSSSKRRFEVPSPVLVLMCATTLDDALGAECASTLRKTKAQWEILRSVSGVTTGAGGGAGGGASTSYVTTSGGAAFGGVAASVAVKVIVDDP